MFPYPYAVLFGAALAAGLVTVAFGRKPAFRRAGLAVSVLSLLLLLAELWAAGLLSLAPVLRRNEPDAWVRRRPRSLGSYPSDYIRKDPVLGYAACANATSVHKVVRGDRVVFDATYRSDSNGLRRTPASHAEDARNAAFFGCSVTFGWGVQDEESMPYVFAAESGGRFRAFNFGLNGYGPHQMLRVLETGALDSLVPGGPDLVVYQALPAHAYRAAGKSYYLLWDTDGPRYVRGSDGVPRHAGPFMPRGRALAFKALRRSHIFKRAFPHLQRMTEDDVALFMAVLRQARAISETRYNARFIVIYWPNKAQRYSDEIARQLAAGGFECYSVDDILPDRASAGERYVIRGDEHPSPLAHRLIAEFLLARVE